MSNREPDKRRPVRLCALGQHSVDVRREPVSLSLIVDRWPELGSHYAILERARLRIRKRWLDRLQARLELLRDRESLARRVCDHVWIREPVFDEPRVEDLDLQLKQSRINAAGDERLRLRYARRSQPGVSNAREMISAEHVAEFVLIAELHVPVGVPEKTVRPLARPPRLLEVVVQVGVPTHERGGNSGTDSVELALAQRAVGSGNRFQVHNLRVRSRNRARSDRKNAPRKTIDSQGVERACRCCSRIGSLLRGGASRPANDGADEQDLIYERQ